MKIKLWQSTLLATILSMTTSAVNFNPVMAQQTEATIDEDELITLDGIPWAAEGWPFSKIVEIRETLVNSVVGRTVIDLHGVDTDCVVEALCSPFSLAPGNLIIVSMWSSKLEGCAVELVVQHTLPTGEEGNKIVPVRLDIGIEDNLISLIPQQNATPTVSQRSYTSGGNGGINILGTRVGGGGTQRGILYASRNVFVVDATVASLLSNAPEKEVRARVSFADAGFPRKWRVFPIGVETVKRWRSVFGFNSTCRPL